MSVIRIRPLSNTGIPADPPVTTFSDTFASHPSGRLGLDWIAENSRVNVPGGVRWVAPEWRAGILTDATQGLICSAIGLNSPNTYYSGNLFCVPLMNSRVIAHNQRSAARCISTTNAAGHSCICGPAVGMIGPNGSPALNEANLGRGYWLLVDSQTTYQVAPGLLGSTVIPGGLPADFEIIVSFFATFNVVNIFINSVLTNSFVDNPPQFPAQGTPGFWGQMDIQAGTTARQDWKNFVGRII